MAKLIPNLNACLSRMTSGEKRVAKRLESLLDDDYLCWYDIPVGRKRRYPDFIVLHPDRGLLFLEVKDWRLENIKRLSKSHAELLTNNGRVTVANPIEQVRQCAYQVVNLLVSDPQLVAQTGDYKGKLKLPYGYGVVFPNILQSKLRLALTEDGTHLLPDHMVLCKDEMPESMDEEAFQKKLWGMMNFSFQHKLSLPEIERIRWHLFPELRLDGAQEDLFVETENEQTTELPTVPEVIKVMDIQQEQIARNLGDGHRVIHGVAGSGKTMILGFRALQLSDALNKPILVLCFNVSLAARLRSYIAEKQIKHKVQVYHFHDWCGQQIKTYHCEVVDGEAAFWERQVQTVIDGVNRSQIPRAQYGAVMIDEGHDFEPGWLELITQMVDPDTDSLLLLYDDAQSIYRKNKTGLDFSLSSVGINARGRTTILKLNYRNTREILEFAYNFAREFITAEQSDDDHIPVIEPESAGATGPAPVFRQFDDQDKELDYITRCITKWLEDGHPLGEVAVLAMSNSFAQSISGILNKAGINNLCMADRKNKAAYDPESDQVSILTVHSSKGLEFDTVVLAGIDKIQYVAEELSDQVRLMYVGMTRAKSQLLITSSKSTPFTERLVDLVAP